MPAELPAGVDKIRVICKQRRIRLEEFFATFDRLRTKKCSAAQFERALDIAGVKRVLSKKDNDADQTIAELAAFYTLPEDPLMVDYLRFCDTVNEAQPSHAVATMRRRASRQPAGARRAGLHDERPRERPRRSSSRSPCRSRRPTPSSSALQPPLPTGTDADGSEPARRDAPYNKTAASSSRRARVRETHRRGATAAVPRRQDFFLDFDHNNDGCIRSTSSSQHLSHRAQAQRSQAELLVKAYDAATASTSARCRRTSRDERRREKLPPALPGGLGPEARIRAQALSFTGSKGKGLSTTRRS